MVIGICANEYFSTSAEGEINRMIIDELKSISPEMNFYFFADTVFSPKFSKVGHAHFFAVKQGEKNGLRRKWFQTVYLPKAIKKTGIEVMIYLRPDEVCRQPIPQFLALNDAALISSWDIKRMNLLKAVIVTSTYLKVALAQLHLISDEKISLVEGIKNIGFNAPSFDDKYAAKEAYTGGKPFFVCTDFDIDAEKFVLLLKSFSLFKQRQQSNWCLVVMLRNKKKQNVLNDLLSNYKYRTDVKLMSNLHPTEFHLILASAYCLISVSDAELFPVSVFESFFHQVPAIALNTKTNSEYADVLKVVEQKKPAPFSEKMMIFYKDEALREDLATKGNDFLTKFDFEKQVSELKTMLLQTKQR
jgi:hypothetical protein